VVWAVVSVLAFNAIYLTFSALHRAAARTGDAAADLDEAGRFLEDLKADVRQARAIRAWAGILWLRMPDGREVMWSFAAEGGVARESPRDDRGYLDAFDSVVFGRRGRLVTADVELRRDPRGAFRPRLRAAVFPRNEGGPRAAK
jgi:hypothetical protein